MNKYFLILLAFLFSLGCFGQEVVSEAESPVKPVHLIGDTEDVNAFIKQYVESNIAVWQQRGEFEKSEAYKERVTPDTRNQQAEVFAKQALDVYIQAYIARLKDTDFMLKTYDADNETFLIESSELGEIVLNVPIGDAPSFKQNFNDLEYCDFNFYVKNNALHLSQMKVKNPVASKEYSFDITESTSYMAENIDYNFDPLDVALGAEETDITSGARIGSKDTKVGKDPVDTDIPETAKQLDNTFALVIGNENYQSEQSVPYATNDAEVMKKYLVKTLGIPENRVRLYTDATLGNLMGGIDWLKKVAKAYEGEASLIFYYAGHGMPDEGSKDAFILPVDGSSDNVQTAYSLNQVYKELNAYPTKQVSVFMDACFSGASRDGMLAEGRGVKIEPKKEVLTGKMLVFSAATGKQTAHPYEDKGHGLFTYFLLKKLQESKGDISYGALVDYVEENVKRKAIDDSKVQTPDVNVSLELKDSWEGLRIGE